MPSGQPFPHLWVDGVPVRAAGNQATGEALGLTQGPDFCPRLPEAGDQGHALPPLRPTARWGRQGSRAWLRRRGARREDMSSWKVAAGKSPESEHGPSERDGGVWPGSLPGSGQGRGGRTLGAGRWRGETTKGAHGRFYPKQSRV